MAYLKDQILSKIDQTFNELKLEFLSELKYQIKKEVSEAIKTEIKKLTKELEELESKVSLLQEHEKNFQKQVSVLKRKNEELQQYGRRLCLRKEGVPSVENKSSDDDLDKVKSLITESECEIPNVVIDRAHRIGKW